ncbi:MAG: adenosylcobinamide-GDP ribazoletransferase [Pseudomonadota bacterium]
MKYAKYIPEPRIIADEVRLMLRAWGFLTRAPVPAWAWGEDRDLGRSMRWFPLAGAGVGVVAGVVYAVLANLGKPDLAAAGLALAAGALLTGALHEDGLADTVDGLGGGADKEQALEIMRDSRIGTYGAVTLMLAFVVKAGALASHEAVEGLVFLVCAHASGRAAIALAACSAPYVRRDGMGRFAETTLGNAGIAVGVAALFALSAGAHGLLALIFALIAGQAVLFYLRKRLGGWTGDGLGAIEQAAEVTALVVLSATLQ